MKKQITKNLALEISAIDGAGRIVETLPPGGHVREFSRYFSPARAHVAAFPAIAPALANPDHPLHGSLAVALLRAELTGFQLPSPESMTAARAAMQPAERAEFAAELLNLSRVCFNFSHFLTSAQ